MEGFVVVGVLALLAVPVMLIAALSMISGLKRRVGQLERDVAQLRSRTAEAPTAQEPTLADWMREHPPAAAAPPPPAPERPAPVRAAEPSPPPTTSPPPPLPPSPPPRLAAPPSRPDPVVLAARAIRHWFTEGNVPVKVGMLVLFAGVAALLKYASDQGWMTLPIELRLSGIALAAIAGLGFGWRQRENKRSFALSLQGGAIGVLLLVVFAAFKLYHLMPAGAAFGLSVAIVAGAGVLAVAQNALALAVLGTLAGFLAPLWLSTGSGNHVALFGYYAVLNAAILAIAWWRPWRMLNVLGFVFTFGIGTLWGVWSYRPEKFDTTEPFLLLFFAYFLLIPIFYARRRPAGRRDLVDGCLVFGTPLVAFSLQAGLVHGSFPDDSRMLLAYCALALGALYALLSWGLHRREHFAALAAPYAVLAVGFATLAVPLALSAQATASVFALEGAGLVWLGLRQRRRLPQLSGVLLQLLAAGSFALGTAHFDATLPPLANARFMGAALIALAGFASAWSYRREDEASPIALPYYLWGLAWWLGNGVTEIARHVDEAAVPASLLAFAAVTGWIAAMFHRRMPTGALAWTVASMLFAALPLAIVQTTEHGHPFARFGAAAWALYALAGWLALRCLRATGGAATALAHSAWLWAWPFAIGLFLHDAAQHAGLGEGWLMAASALPWLLVTALVQWRPALVATPLSAEFELWREPLQASFVVSLALAAIMALFAAGESRPLAWLPILNPLDLAQLAVLGLVLKWLGSELSPRGLQRRRIQLIAAAAFAMVTVITLRATHHWGGVAWAEDMLSASLVQTSLTIVWSVLGVLGWIVGSRRGQRGLWLAGAVLMAVVLAKLVLVDRQHLGNLLGIASFIAYGLLCTAVGYFAPAPPRTGPQEEALGEPA